METRNVVNADGGLVIAAGAGGTIGGVAGELVGTNTVLGIIPVGTMNNLARSLGVPLGVDEACALIGMGSIRYVDAGRVSSGGDTKIHVFFDGAGLGIHAVAAVAGQAYQKRLGMPFPERCAGSSRRSPERSRWRWRDDRPRPRRAW